MVKWVVKVYTLTYGLAPIYRHAMSHSHNHVFHCMLSVSLQSISIYYVINVMRYFFTFLLKKLITVGDGVFPPKGGESALLRWSFGDIARMMNL